MSQAEELLETISTDSNVFPTAEPGVYEHGSNFTTLLYTWDDLCNGVNGTIKGPYDGEIEEIEVEGDLVLPEILDEATGERLTYISYCTCGDVVIPASVTNIDYLLCYASNSKEATESSCMMETIYVKATTPPVIEIWKVTEDMPYIKKVVVPKGCGDTYVTNWGNLADFIVEGEDASTGDDTSDGDTSDNETILDPNEPHIVIGRDRNITVPESLKRIAVQHDHNVETVTFDCPRYWDGIDFAAKTDDVNDFAIYINYMLTDGTLGSYVAENISVDADDSNMMHFTWTISENVTLVFGKLTFLVCIKKVNEVETEHTQIVTDENGDPVLDEDGNEQTVVVTETETVLVNHWNSELCKDLYVSEGLETTDTISEMYPDFITQVLTTLDRFNQSDYGQVVSRIEVLEADTENLDGRMEIAETNIADLKPRMTTAENSIGTLDERVTATEDDIDNLKPRMTTAESDIAGLKPRMATAESDIDAIQEILGTGDGGVLSIERGGTGASTTAGAVSNLKSDLVDLILPVGSLIKISPSGNIDPNTVFGGVWVEEPVYTTCSVTYPLVKTITSTEVGDSTNIGQTLIGTVDNLRDALREKYGMDLIGTPDLTTIGVHINNGDTATNPGVVVGESWYLDTTYEATLYARHIGMVAGKCRFNITVSVMVTDSRYKHWWRTA